VIQPGRVIDVFAAHITPPHRKYYVITCLEPLVLGFFINSEINQYVQKRPRLLAAQIPVLQTEHGFLSYDSWLDCSDVHTFTLAYLEREIRTNPAASLGHLSAIATEQMLAAVRDSYTLVEEQISWICAEFGVPRCIPKPK
jgi:hypothetical protein